MTCKYSNLAVGSQYTTNFAGASCDTCSAPLPTNHLVVYRGHESYGGQTCDAFVLVARLTCGACGALLQVMWDPCAGGFTSDLFARQPATAPASADTDEEAQHEEN